MSRLAPAHSTWKTVHMNERLPAMLTREEYRAWRDAFEVCSTVASGEAWPNDGVRAMYEAMLSLRVTYGPGETRELYVRAYELARKHYAFDPYAEHLDKFYRALLNTMMACHDGDGPHSLIDERTADLCRVGLTPDAELRLMLDRSVAYHRIHMEQDSLRASRRLLARVGALIEDPVHKWFGTAMRRVAEDCSDCDLEDECLQLLREWLRRVLAHETSVTTKRQAFRHLVQKLVRFGRLAEAMRVCGYWKEVCDCSCCEAWTRIVSEEMDDYGDEGPNWPRVVPHAQA